MKKQVRSIAEIQFGRQEQVRNLGSFCLAGAAAGRGAAAPKRGAATPAAAGRGGAAAGKVGDRLVTGQ